MIKIKQSRLWAVLVPRRPNFTDEKISFGEIEKMTAKMIFMRQLSSAAKVRFAKSDYRIDIFVDEKAMKVAAATLKDELGVNEEDCLASLRNAARKRKLGAMAVYAGECSNDYDGTEWRCGEEKRNTFRIKPILRLVN